MPNVVHVDNSVIDRLAAESGNAQLFPCLQQYTRQAPQRRGGGCGRCGHKAAAVTTSYDTIRRCFIDMGPARIKQLKAKLNAGQLRIEVRTARRIVRYTI